MYITATTQQYLQFRWKGYFSKFLEELLFGTYNAFLDRAAKHRSFCYFTKKWFHYRRSRSNFYNSWNKQTKEAFLLESVFVIVVGGYIGQLEFFKRNVTKDVFLIIFKNFHNSSFSNIPWKMYEVIIKWLHYRRFSGKFRNISEHSKGNIFLGACVCWSQKFWAAGLQR